MNVTSEELRALKPIVVATIGPTNEGKTSLLRTLTGDPNFGLVNAFNGTTVRAEIQKVFFRGIAEILQLVDTPGFQTSGEILEALAEDPEVEANDGAFGLDDVLRVVPKNDDDYRHDLRAWNEVARCDVVIFVANVVEDPNQSLIKHTLGILKNVGKPVVVAYNNLGDADENWESRGIGKDGENGGSRGSGKNGENWESRGIGKDGENGGSRGSGKDGENGGSQGSGKDGGAEGSGKMGGIGATFNDFRADWDAVLQKNGFYLIQTYDAHRRSFRDEIALFEKIAALVRDPLRRRVLQLEMEDRRIRELRRLENSRKIVAELLLDVAAYREIETNVAREDWRARLERLEDALKQNVMRREHQAHLELLETWGFRIGVLDREALVVDDVANETDQIFGAEAQRHFKVGGGVGAAVGAAVGAVVDVGTAGLSLGGGAALGAFLGGVLGGGGAAFYNRRYDPKGKKLTVRPDQNVAIALTSRAVDLIQKLQTRGKAIEDSTQTLVSARPKRVDVPGLTAELAALAERDEFSKMNKNVDARFKTSDWRRLPGVSALAKEQKTRDDAIQTLVELLKKATPDFE
ncbi:MAG: DUF3482 domain-containing protein [Thermoguttaceae bacterium]|nr:DUF3482 domain-containing protein [Thermoguttaceae bacterium]